MEALRVVPVHPAEGRELEFLDLSPGARACGPADEFGLVVTVHGLGQGIVKLSPTVPTEGVAPISARRSP